MAELAVNSKLTRSCITLGNNAQMNSIYDRIIIARKEAGLPTTLSAIGKDVGISHASVFKWKHGKGVRVAHVVKIGMLTGFCPEWLFTGRGPRRPPSKTTTDLMAELDSLSDEDREEVLRFARFRATD